MKHPAARQDEFDRGNVKPAPGYRPLAYSSPEAVQTTGTVAIPQPAEEDYNTRIARREVWLIERDEHAVGVAVLEERPDHLLVHSIAVRPTEQRRGYGRALLAFADRRAVAIGVPEIRLFTNTRMKRNIALYRRYGYAEVGVRPHPNRSGQFVVDMARRANSSLAHG